MKHGEGVQYGSLGYTYATAEGAGGGGGYLGILRINGKKFKKRERYSSLSEKDTRGKGTVQMDRAPEMCSDDRSG